MTIDISLNDKAKLPTHGIVLLTGKEEKTEIVGLSLNLIMKFM